MLLWMTYSGSVYDGRENLIGHQHKSDSIIAEDLYEFLSYSR